MNGLEALKKLPKWLDDEHRDSEEEYFKASEEYKAIEKELKAFEIIKEKRVNVYAIEVCCSATDYNDEIDEYDDVTKPLTQDEFNLLKEVMKC